MFGMGTTVRSLRDTRITGQIVGYGSLTWPQNSELHGDDEQKPVYLVQVAYGSSSLCRACIVLRVDQVEEVKCR